MYMRYLVLKVNERMYYYKTNVYELRIVSIVEDTFVSISRVRSPYV